MSEFTDILVGRLDVKHLTPFLLDETAAGTTHAFNRQPAKASRLEINVRGAAVAAGSAVVDGSTVETIAIDDNGSWVGEKDFTSLTTVVLSGITGGYVSVRAVTPTGQPINQEVVRHTSLPVRFYPMSGKIRMVAAGQKNVATYKFMAAPDKVIEANDLVYAVSGIPGITMGQVSFVEEIVDFDGATHHMEAEVVPL